MTDSKRPVACRRDRPGIATVTLIGAIVLAACGPPPTESEPEPVPWFIESAAETGLLFRHESGQRERKLFPEIMGGGVALFDMDGDEDLDVYLVQSGSLLDPAETSPGNRLFENVEGRFVDVTENSGAGDRGYGMGATAGDYDNDGRIDLYVTNYGANVLLRNTGSGRFEDVSTEAGVADPEWSVSAAFLDYDLDGDLDLFFTNYIHWTVENERECYNTAGVPDYCLPTNYETPAMDRLYRNEGDGTFTDVSVEAGFREAFGNGLGVVCSDFNDDGWVDIFVANDTMMNQLWINQGDGRFVDEALLRGNALDEHGTAKAGMGVAVADIDDDGDEDLLVGNLVGQTDSLFVNRGGLFRDSTGAQGLGAVSRGFTRFGLGFHDFDNDGRLDLFQANGRVILDFEPETDDPYAEANVLLRGRADGGFEEVLPRGGTSKELIATSRAAAFGDLNGDGGVDVVVINRDAPVHLLLNVVPDRGHWARVRVVEPCGRDAYGARVVIVAGDRRITRTVRAAYSYGASSDPAVHVGLGEIDRVDSIQVTWPDGHERVFGPQQVDRTLVLAR